MTTVPRLVHGLRALHLRGSHSAPSAFDIPSEVLSAGEPGDAGSSVALLRLCYGFAAAERARKEFAHGFPASAWLGVEGGSQTTQPRRRPAIISGAHLRQTAP